MIDWDIERDPSADIRITGLRAYRLVHNTAMPVLARMAADPSPQVRREVAVALRHTCTVIAFLCHWTAILLIVLDPLGW